MNIVVEMTSANFRGKLRSIQTLVSSFERTLGKDHIWPNFSFGFWQAKPLKSVM